jgi:hypothetical protein
VGDALVASNESNRPSDARPAFDEISMRIVGTSEMTDAVVDAVRRQLVIQGDAIATESIHVPVAR